MFPGARRSVSLSDSRQGQPVASAEITCSIAQPIDSYSGELLFGFRNGSRYAANLRELETFLQNPYVTFLPVSWRTAERFSRVALQLKQKGTPIPVNDIWIAAHAMETGADLISYNEHFEVVDGLAWIQPEGLEE